AMRSHRSIPYAIGIAAIFMLELAVPAAGQAAKTPAIHIDNFGCVNPRYYRGAQPKASDYPDLAGLGIHLVLDLTKDGDPHEPTVVQNLGMKFYRIPMTTRATPSLETIALFLNLVSDPANQPVYVHCQGGRHRTGLMTAIYRMTQDGWAPARAYEEMKQYRFEGFPGHPALKKFVLGYKPSA